MADKNGSRVTFRLSMTLGLAGTIAAGIWWAAAFTQEVRTMQDDIVVNRDRSVDMGEQVFSLRVRAAADDATGKAVQQRLNSIDNILQRIERKIDRATQGEVRQ